MKRKPQTGFGAVFSADDPHVPAWTIASAAYHVREEVGRQWCKEDPASGWKAAKIEGARVVKVEIRIMK